MRSLVVFESWFGNTRRIAEEIAQGSTRPGRSRARVGHRRPGLDREAAESFFVQGTPGPLEAGELERAAAWGRELASSA
jgi:flavodoxin